MIIDSHLHMATAEPGRRYYPERQSWSVYDEHLVFHFGMKRLVDWWKGLPETGKKYGCEFTQEEVDLVLGGNVARILGIDKGPEWEIKDTYGWRRRYPSPNRS